MLRFGTIPVYLCLWIFLLLGSPFAGEPTPSKEDRIAPKAVFIDLDHHFGEVLEGAEISHDFIVENQGSAPLVIKNIRPD